MAAKQLGPKRISNQSYGVIQLGLNVAGVPEKLRQLSKSSKRKVAQKGKKPSIRFNGTIRFPWGRRHDSFSRLTTSRLRLTIDDLVSRQLRCLCFLSRSCVQQMAGSSSAVPAFGPLPPDQPTTDHRPGRGSSSARSSDVRGRRQYGLGIGSYEIQKKIGDR